MSTLVEPCDLGKWLQLYAMGVIAEGTFSQRFGCMEQGGDVGGLIETVDGFGWGQFFNRSPDCGQHLERRMALSTNHRHVNQEIRMGFLGWLGDSPLLSYRNLVVGHFSTVARRTEAQFVVEKLQRTGNSPYCTRCCKRSPGRFGT